MWRKKSAWITVIALAAAIKLFSLFPNAVEKYYANGIYPVISGTQRILFGWIPFSIGDILYAVVVIWLLVRLYKMVKLIVQRNTTRRYWIDTLAKSVFVVLVVYVSFNLLWGLNYNRKGVSKQLSLVIGEYSKYDLEVLMDELVIRLNRLDSTAKIDRPLLAKKRELFNGAQEAYRNLATHFPVMHYSFTSVKPSLFSYLGNYLGYTGYYNPFTGEAQVNTTVPLFIQPFTTCHEMGHQLGYAKENEANFAGFLAARSSNDPTFKYSVYFDMYAYSRYYLYTMDSLAAKQRDSLLRPGVKQDYRELREFVRKHRNPIEAVIDKLYGQYLKANEQPKGRLTYSEVIAWLISYYTKYGKDAI